MRSRLILGTGCLLLALLLSLAGCTRGEARPGDSRLLIPGLSDETPNDRLRGEPGYYIQNLPR